MERLCTKDHLLHGESFLRDTPTGRFAYIAYMLSLKILHLFLDQDDGRSVKDRQGIRSG